MKEKEYLLSGPVGGDSNDAYAVSKNGRCKDVPIVIVEQYNLNVTECDASQYFIRTK